MSALTTTEDLLNGVGEFPMINQRELLRLIPEPHRSKGLSTAVTPWHNAAWERCVNDFARDEIDITGTLTTAMQKAVKAACCFLIMSMLYRLSSDGNRESDDWKNSKWYLEEYERIKGGISIVMPHGPVVQVSDGISLFRS